MTEGTRYSARLDITNVTDELLSLSVTGREEVSRPFEYQISFDSLPLVIDALRGAGAHLQIVDRLTEEIRHVTGVIREAWCDVKPVSHAGETLRHTVVVVPEPHLVLDHRRGFRIFQELDVKAIVEKVYTDAGLPVDLFAWDLKETSHPYPTRTYCVQYDESEWSFICRLLEEEGIWFSFVQTEAGCTMTFRDMSDVAPELEPKTLDYADWYAWDAPHAVWDWANEARFRTCKTALTDYDFEHPTVPMSKEASTTEVFDREHYEYPGRYTDPDGQGARLVQTRLDEHRTGSRVYSGYSTAIHVQPGHRLELSGHPATEDHLFVTAIRMVFPTFDVTTSAQHLWLEAIPKLQKYRPERRTPRPHVVGLQTARVTGPEGSEIHPDRFARIKVQLRWDREGQLDDHTSCWLRVAQQHTTGSIQVPRVGWEVLVEFVDGDPDRPICLGKLWNPFQPPPATLPDQKTQTHFASQSSPGGGGMNQIIMEDASGGEQLLVNACHDVTIKAANNKTHSTGNNASHTVGANRVASVGGNETNTVDANYRTSVTGNQTVDVSANRTIKADGTLNEETTATMSLTVKGLEHIMVGNPISAVLEVVAAEAIQRVSAAGAGAVSRAANRVLGPAMGAINQARGALGPALQMAGPAQALLGGGDPTTAMFGQALGALGGPGAGQQVGQMATGMLASAASAEIASLGASAVRSLTGGGGGGGGGGPEGATGATAGGSGIWNTKVKSDVTEKIGGAAIINTAAGAVFGIGGSLKETIGALQLQMVKGGIAETTGTAKVETVGVYKLDLAESLTISAKAAVGLNIKGASNQDITGGHSFSATGPVKINAGTMELKGDDKINITVGDTSVTITGGKITFKATSKITFKASNIRLKENKLGS